MDGKECVKRSIWNTIW